jgi:hypothetical protein
MSSGDIICPTCGQYHCVCGLVLQNLANNTFSELGKEHAKTLAEPLGEFIGAEIAKLQNRIAALESQLAWIPVNERLPDNRNVVNVCSAAGLVGEAYYDNEYESWYWNEHFCCHAYPTHWRPLPEPPHESRIQEAQK